MANWYQFLGYQLWILEIQDINFGDTSYGLQSDGNNESMLYFMNFINSRYKISISKIPEQFQKILDMYFIDTGPQNQRSFSIFFFRGYPAVIPRYHGKDFSFLWEFFRKKASKKIR